MANGALPAAPDATRLTPTELMEVRDCLAAAGLRDDEAGPRLDFASGQVNAARLPLVLATLRARSDAKSLLTRVFAYGDTVAASDLDQAVGPTTLDRLGACNLIGSTPSGDLACPVLLRPLASLLLASDRAGSTGDAVMAPGPTTANLARALPLPPLGRVLDLGTGSGVLALLAASTEAEVTAVDITERACAFTRFNAALNGLCVDVRRGDLFEPVAGEQFDLVLSHPPFVVQPPDIEPTAYIHGGPTGDELALRILGGLGDVLVPGGSALLRFDAPGLIEDVVRNVRSILDQSFDLGVFGFRTVGPDLIAVGYAGLADPTLGTRYQNEVIRYLRHMAALGVDQFIGTLTLVHRPADTRPVLTVSAEGRAVPRWWYMAARLAAERLAASSQAVLADVCLSPLPDATLSAELGLEASGLRPSYAVRYPGGSVSLDVELNETGAAVLQLFAGGKTVRAVSHDYAVSASKTRQEADADIATFARDALRRGLLVPRLP